MTVDRLLREISSRELAEWLVLQDLDKWQRTIEEKEGPEPSTVMNALFGKALQKGQVRWQKPKELKSE